MSRRTKALPPRRKRMLRAARLQSGRRWLERFTGKRVVASYARWFGVDIMCAARELQILGVRFPADYLEALRRTAAGRRKPLRRATGEASAWATEASWHPDFAYVIGYTQGGFPYGVTWSEMEEFDRRAGKGGADPLDDRTEDD